MVVVAQEKIDRYTNQGWWGHRTLWDLYVEHCQQRPQATAVVDAANRSDFAYGHKQSLTWLTLSRAVNALSWHLLQHGLNRDNVVIAQMPNCVEQFVVYLACSRLGLIVSPVPIQFRENELHTILDITQAKAVVTFASLGQKERQHDAQRMWLTVQSQHTHLKNVVVWGDQQAQHIQIEDMLKGVSTLQLEAIEHAHKKANITANDVFTICWTSGTEAQPKGVPRSHNEWLVVAPSII
ncbi:MAG: short-chain-fatty-acid--CoA ligase, partial [Limnohabitans sp.]|nr:short-chain-fatty-acid--CoA ligase [Limnohabitans sp.]